MADDDDLDALLDDAADDVFGGSGAGDDKIHNDVASGGLQQATPAAPSIPPRQMLHVPSRQAAAPPPAPPRPPTLEEVLQHVLPKDLSSKWIPIIKEDEARQAAMPRPRPPSYAYQSFQSKRRGGSSAAVEGGGDGEEGKEEGKSRKQTGPAAALPELILRAGTAAGLRDTEVLRKGLKANPKATERLQDLFLVEMAKDLKGIVEHDPDFDPSRFPATNTCILGKSR